MRLPRLQFTVRALMVAVVFTAIWSFIIAQSLIYQREHLGPWSAWSDPP